MVDFRSIVIHAVAACETRAQQALGVKCVYCQLDMPVDGDNDAPMVCNYFEEPVCVRDCVSF